MDYCLALFEFVVHETVDDTCFADVLIAEEDDLDFLGTDLGTFGDAHFDNYCYMLSLTYLIIINVDKHRIKHQFIYSFIYFFISSFIEARMKIAS